MKRIGKSIVGGVSWAYSQAPSAVEEASPGLLSTSCLLFSNVQSAE